MSGHSKWSTIKRAKGVADATRGKIFTRHAKAIQIAAREGGSDPAMNATLSAAIENAKSDNLPKDNIERAIKKGTGELVGEKIEEKIYEGYGPNGVALIIKALTDNPNRTMPNIRHILSKNGGKIAESGSVVFQFEKKGIIIIEYANDLSTEAQKAKVETIELEAIDAGADDVESRDEVLIVKTDPKKLMAVRKNLLDKNIEVKSAELSFEAINEIQITEKEVLQKIMKLIDLLEEDEDVDSVSTNADFDKKLLD
jgi:YebC/PmpR family DNA-binding regulatory protein